MTFGFFRWRPLAVLALLLLPDLLWIGLAAERLHAFQHGLAFTLCMLIGALAWSQRRPGVLLLLGLPFALLVPLECYYISRYSFPSTAHILAIIGETNLTEASEYFGHATGFLLFGLTLAIGAIFVHELRQVGFKPIYAPHRAWRWLGFAMFLPFISLALAELTIKPEIIPEKNDLRGQQSQGTLSLLKDVRFGMDKVVTSSFPFGVPFRVSTYLAEQRRLAAARQSFKNIRIVAQGSESAPSELVVLIIGESANPGHWHANGYSRQTTPEVEKIDAATSLGDVISPWSTTRFAVPSLLTGTLDENGLPPIAVPSVLDVFRSAGWETYWLSNQSPLGMHDSTIMLHAERAEYRYFLNGADYAQQADYDEILIPAFEKVLRTRPEKKKLVILHLLGSHLDYANRYPPAFAKFDEMESVSEKVGGFAAFHNKYDNSIFYTDHVLARIISRLKASNKASALIYASDHGQNIPDLECSKYGHGHSTVDSYRTAALTWTSPELQDNLPGIAERLRQRKSQPLHLLDVFHTLIDVSGINYAGFDSSRSWVNQSWRYRPRPVWVVPDFDAQAPSGACRIIQSPAHTDSLPSSAKHG